MITKKLLCWYKDGEHSVHLHTTRDTTGFYYIGVYKDQELFCPMQSTSSPTSGNLCMYYGGTYQAVDITPIMYVYYVNHTHSTEPYNPKPETYGTLQIATTDTNHISHGSINNIVELQGVNNGSWSTVLQLPAGGTVANVYNISVSSTTFRFKIGSWTSSTFTLNGASGSASRSIPEAQWGV